MVIGSDFETRSYKSLFLRFGRQFFCFVCGVLIASGVVYGIERQFTWDEPNFDELNDHRERAVATFLNTSAYKAVKLFGDTHNVEDGLVKEFIHDLTKLAWFRNSSSPYLGFIDHRIDFLQAFVLTISTITTVGWGHVTPFTIGGKVFTSFMAIFGIPLTFIMVISGSQIVIRLAKDAVRKTAGPNRVSLLYKPFISLLLFIYVLLFAEAIAVMEDFDYTAALWYSVMSLTTVGYGDVVQYQAIRVGQESHKAGLAIFLMLWLVFGFILIGALLLGFVYDHWGAGRNTQFHQIFKNRDEELVDNIEDLENA